MCGTSRKEGNSAQQHNMNAIFSVFFLNLLTVGISYYSAQKVSAISIFRFATLAFNI